MKNKLLTKLILLIASVVFLSLPFENLHLTFLGYIALIPLLFLIYQFSNKKQAFLWGWLCGTVFYIFAFRWFFCVLGEKSMGINNNFTGITIISFALIITSAITGLSFGLFTLFSYIILKLKKLYLIILLPCIWTILEYIKAILFSLITYGKNASLGPFFSFSDLGYLLEKSNFFYLSRFIGLYGLTFLIVFINVIIFLCIKKRNIIVVFIIILLLTAGYFPLSKSSHKKTSINILAVNTDPESSFYAYGFLNMLKRKNINFSNQPYLVIFPEGFYLFSHISNLERKILKEIFPYPQKQGFIIANRIFVSDKNKISQVVYRNNYGKIIAVENKSFLIPGGETAPYFLLAFIKLIKKEKILKIFETKRELQKSKFSFHGVKLGKIKVGTFLCGGVLSPIFFRKLTKNGAEVLINPASYTLLHYHLRITNELFLMSKFTAVSNNKPLIQAIQGGSSMVIDENGNIIKKGEKNQLLLTKITPNKTKPPIVYIGDDFFVLVCLLLCLIFLIKNKNSF